MSSVNSSIPEEKLQALLKKYGGGKVAQAAARAALESRGMNSSVTSRSGRNDPLPPKVDIDRMFSFEVREPAKPTWELQHVSKEGPSQPRPALEQENARRIENFFRSFLLSYELFRHPLFPVPLTSKPS